MLISKYGNGSENLVNEFENKYCIDIDEEYRRFLIKYNGGDTPNTKVRIRGFSSNLRHLFGINAKKNIEDYLQILPWEKHYLPIGMDYHGNYFVIGLEDDKGIVYFCNHDRGFALKKITDSFSEFLSKCKSEGIDPITLIPPEDRETMMIAEGRAQVITDVLREIWKQEYEKYKNMILEEVLL